MRIPGADSWVQEDRWEARGSMPGSYGLPTITDDQGGHIAYVVSAEHARVLAAALDMLDAHRAVLAKMDAWVGAPSPAERSEIRSIMEAAIAKATGQEACERCEGTGKIDVRTKNGTKHERWACPGGCKGTGIAP